jgi:hypothetical protein
MADAAGNPALAQRVLRRELRERREQLAFTRTQVTAALDWSVTKLLRFETGQSRVSVTDVRALLDRYRITDAAAVERYLALCRAAKQRGWWSQYRPALGPALTTFFVLESNAERVRQFHSALVPELLQTPGYADGVDQIRTHQDPHLIAATRAARPIRQALVAATDGPAFTFIVEDQALWRRIGGPHTWDAQLVELATRLERHQIDLRVTPLNHLGSLLVRSGVLTVMDHDEQEPTAYRLDPQLNPTPYTGDGTTAPTASTDLMDTISAGAADTHRSLAYIQHVRQCLASGGPYTPLATQCEEAHRSTPVAASWCCATHWVRGTAS